MILEVIPYRLIDATRLCSWMATTRPLHAVADAQDEAVAVAVLDQGESDRPDPT